MAVTVKFSQMPVLPAATSTMRIPGLDNGVNVVVTAGAIAALVTKQSLGLGNVADLAPADLPISNATNAALMRKMDVDSLIPMSQITGINDALANKLDKTAAIPQSQVTGLEERLLELETGNISVSRVEGFVPAVNDVIATHTELVPTVSRGVTGW